jgi:branched-subunit amino acid aminotransferase/4-amino-4-deoxychorismate lyase
MSLLDSVPINDRGLLLGDGLFETLLVERGAVIDLEPHLDRMAAGCETLGFPALDRVAAARAVADAAGSLAAERAALRLTLTAGSGGRGLDRPASVTPRLFATAAALGAAPEPARLVLSQVRRNEGSPASRWKTLAYLDNVLARREALAAGGDEALMLNSRGELACAAAANLFWISGGRLFTPALECGVLAGVMRARVLARAAHSGLEVAQVRAGPDALATAEGAFLTNSLTGVRPVATLDGRSLPIPALIARLAEA